MAKVNKRLFSVAGVDLAATRPTPQAENRAQLAYGRAFREAVENGLMVRTRLDRYLRDQGIWDDEKEEEYHTVLKRVWDSEKRLAMGGNAGLTKAKARELAIQMRRDRATLFLLNRDRNELDMQTAEVFAEQAKFDTLVALCVLDEKSGKPYFKSVDEYKSKAGEEDREKAAVEFGRLYYGFEDDRDKKLPENAFLLEYGFCDEKLRLVNKDGHLVDAEGNLVDEQGRRVNEKGELIDPEGTPIDEDGNYVVEFAPFLDDEDQGSEDADPTPTPLLPDEGPEGPDSLVV